MVTEIEWREKDKEFSIDGCVIYVARIKRSKGKLFCIASTIRKKSSCG
jgi:hypothetical protein